MRCIDETVKRSINMVAQITVKLLLSLFAIRATAQVPTIVARPVDEYKLSEVRKVSSYIRMTT